jgi:hypothetical protein
MKQSFAECMVLFLLVTAVSCPANSSPPVSDMSSKAFLAKTRTPPGRECWASMSGTVEHRRRGEDTQKTSLYIGIRFTAVNTLAQVLIGGHENYRVIQNYTGESSATVVADAPTSGSSLLADFGLRAEDLTMTFLFWNFLEEKPPEKALGQSCRVFLLESPDHGETVRVFISEEYYFPLKVEWHRRVESGFESKPYRTLEAESFRRENDFWMVSSLSLYGPGWRTQIRFDECRGGYPEDATPEPLFRTPAAPPSSATDGVHR